MVNIIGSLLVILGAVYLLAIITEEFFIISLDEISTRLKLPSDVAGASLMAMGSSAPELFIALLALAIGGNHSDVGIGTIVGSAIFNILVITGMSAVVAGTLELNPGAIGRDIIFYLGSVAILLFVFWNGSIELWEAGLMMVAYIGYLALLWVWSRTNVEDAATETIGGGHATAKKHRRNIFVRLSEFLTRILSIVMPDPKKNYVWVMIASIGFIILLSYALVESAVLLSTELGLPPLIVSLTLLAAGTSAPDLIASIDVAEDGRGTMAISNAVGSNIFDVLVGLGFPWLLTIIIAGHAVIVGTEGLIESVFLLSVTVIILFAIPLYRSKINAHRRLDVTRCLRLVCRIRDYDSRGWIGGSTKRQLPKKMKSCYHSWRCFVQVKASTPDNRHELPVQGIERVQ